MDGTKLNKKQLRRIIREEKARLLREQEDMSMYDDITKTKTFTPQPDNHSKAQAQIVTDMEVPIELFDEMVEFLEDMSNAGGTLGKRAQDLLLKMERELGAL